MYAVEFRFDVIGGGIAPSLEMVAAHIWECGRNPGVWVEHVRGRRIDQTILVVAFVMAATAADVQRWAAVAGARLSAELPLVRFGGFQIWT